MACQFNVYLGLPIFTWEDIPELVRPDLENGFRPNDQDWEPDEVDDLTADGLTWTTTVQLTRTCPKRGEITLPVVLELVRDGEMCISVTDTHRDGDPTVPRTVYGVALTGRYRPVFLDSASDHGNGDVMVLDLDELARHLAVVRSLPGMKKAQVILLHEHY